MIKIKLYRVKFVCPSIYLRISVIYRFVLLLILTDILSLMQRIGDFI